MKRSQVLKEEREALQTELDELVNKGGEYTEQENNRTVELAELIQTKSTDIDQAEAEEKAALIRAAARQKAKGGGEDRELGKIAQRYSFAKAFKSYAQKGKFWRWCRARNVGRSQARSRQFAHQLQPD